MGFLGGVLGASLGTATVAIGVDTKQLATGLAGARAEVESATSATGKLGAAWSAIAPAVTTAAATGVVALGAASVKAALDFENSFTKISALSNASADQIASWKDAVLSLSGETTVAPKELADALYFLASAGLKASDVLPTLEASAKAAAAGMGSTADIARLTAAAMNAYGSENLSAAHATDILAAAIKVGSAEPTEMAEALGQVLPIAQKAGVGFDELTASIGSLTSIGVPVDEAATAVKGALTALTAPGSQAAEALASVGLSVQQLQTTLKDGGIIAAFQLLNDATGGNQEVIRKIIPNVRALTTQYGLTGPALEQAAAAFDQVSNSSGEAASAFQKFLAGPGANFKKLGSDIQVLLIRIGEKLLPAFSDLAAQASDLLEVIGPPLIGAFEGLGTVASSVADAFKLFNDEIDQLKGSIAGLAPGVTDQAATSLGLVGRAAEFAAAHTPVLSTAYKNLKPALDAATASSDDNTVAMDAQASATASAALQASEGATQAAELAAAQHRAADAAREQKAAEDALVGGILGIVSGMQSLADAQDAVNKLQQQGKRGTAEYKDAALNLLQQQSSLNGLFADYAQKLADSGDSQKQIRNGLFDLGRQAGLTRGDVQSLAHDALASLQTQLGGAAGEANNLTNALNRIPKNVTVRVTTQYYETNVVRNQP